MFVSPSGNMGMNLRAFLESRFFGVFITLMILFSVVTFSIETLPDLSEKAKNFLSYSEIFVVAIFTLEYFFRVIVSDKKLGYIFSFYGLIDLLAILPFYLSTSLDLRTLRLFRLLRLFRILKLGRYNRAISRFNLAICESKEELVVFLLATIIVLYLAAVGIYYFEHAVQPQAFKSIFDCLWWSITTLTTVGYGDIYPVTSGGRVFTFIILMLGLGLVAVPTGIVATSLSAIRKKEESDDGV